MAATKTKGVAKSAVPSNDDLDFGGVALPGLYIGDEIGKSDSLMAAIGLVRTNLKLRNLEEAREILSSLPITISFDEIIDFDAADQARKATGPVKRMDLKSAIKVAETCVQKLLEFGIQAEVIPPDTTSASDYEVEKLSHMIAMKRVIMLQGGTGVGKTAMSREAAWRAGVKPDEFAYFSMPTLAPEDFAGIPSPDPDDKHLFYYRMLAGANNAKVIMLDETNRAHPKILNAIMQLMAERRINDMHFPNLGAIILAVNPPEDGNFSGVEELDDAIRERVDCFVEVKARPDKGILARIYTNNGTEPDVAEDVANVLVNWWSELNADQKKACNPRRLEKLGHLHLAGIDVKYGADERKCPLQTEKLAAMLNKIDLLNLRYLYENPDKVEDILRTGTPQQKSDTAFRIKELLEVIKKRGHAQQFVKIAHLVNYLDRDMLPSMERDRSLMGFINRALKKYATPAEAQRWHDEIAARREGRKLLDDKVRAIATKLMAEQEDPSTITV